MTGPFDYSLFGLHIRSDLRLPELHADTFDLEPQVNLRLGPVAAADRSGLVPIEGGALLTVDGIARYAITNGSMITVDRDADVADANVRLYLLGSAMGIVLHQRGLLPLHANAVEIDGRAYAFTGASGAGKSTLAAWFYDHGYRVIADDVCAISFDPDQVPMVAPGLPRLRLWREALEWSGRDAAGFERSYAGDDSWDKFDVPLSRQEAVPEAVPLGGICVLATGEGLSITTLQGIEATEAMFANTYRGAHVPAVGDVGLHWQSCVRLALHTPIFQLVRKWGLDRLGEDVEALVAHIRSSNAAPASACGLDDLNQPFAS